MAKLTTAQATELVNQNEPMKRRENDVFCYWHCYGNLDGYNYRSLRVDSETLNNDATLSQAKTYFINYFKTVDYLGVKPIQSDDIPE